MSRWTVVQHVEFEQPGLVGEVAAERDVALDVYRMDLGHRLPVPAELPRDRPAGAHSRSWARTLVFR